VWLNTGVAVICRQLQQYDGHLTVCLPKTAHSARVVALDRTTVAALRAHRVRQEAERAGYGSEYNHSSYLFTNRNGDPMAPDRLSRTFRQLAAEAGLPPIRLHDLRHGAATLALAAGVDLRVVQEMLGHSSIVLTPTLTPRCYRRWRIRRRRRSPPSSSRPAVWSRARRGHGVGKGGPNARAGGVTAAHNTRRPSDRGRIRAVRSAARTADDVNATDCRCTHRLIRAHCP
jgi:hypothetical protein